MKKLMNFKLPLNASFKNVEIFSVIKGHNCPSNGGPFILHHMVIFNGESQLEYLFGILKVIVQEPGTRYPKRGRSKAFDYKIKQRVN